MDADLDNILLMALRKEPQRRYGSVEQFANDLRNYLAGMPVQARGNSLRYRAGKFVRRRKVEIAAGVLVVVRVARRAGVLDARGAHRGAASAQVAQQHFDSVRKLANTMLFQLHDEMAKDAGLTQVPRNAGEDLAGVSRCAVQARRVGPRSCRRSSPTRTSRWR